MVFIQDLGYRKETERREEKRKRREKKRRKEKANIIILKNKTDILEVGSREGNPKGHFFLDFNYRFESPKNEDKSWHNESMRHRLQRCLFLHIS